MCRKAKYVRGCKNGVNNTSTVKVFVFVFEDHVFVYSLQKELSELQFLTHFFLMHPFSTPWKHQKTFRLSDVLRRQRKGALGINGLSSAFRTSQIKYNHCPRKKLSEMLLRNVNWSISSYVEKHQLNFCLLN